MKGRSRTELIKEIKKIRKAIRSHRDARGDDRCWLDDLRVHATVDGSVSLKVLPPLEQMMERCGEFYTYRRSDEADPMPADAIVAKRFWNQDLAEMTTNQLEVELSCLRGVVTAHMNFSGTRTCDDDRALYSVLPEKVPADFRLPPEDEFLGEAKAPHAGCLSFHRSHANCPNSVSGCSLPQWGPCNKK